MVQIAAIWIISVVAFFALWAILASVIRRISVKRDHKDAEVHASEPDETKERQNNQQNTQQ